MGWFSSKYKKQAKKQERRAKRYEQYYKEERNARKDAAQQLKESQSSHLKKNPYGYIKTKALDYAVKMARKQREEARGRGKEYADEVVGRQYQGLTPQQKMNMEESGQHKLNRQMQGFQRQLDAKQGKSGVRGGAAYAQQADLARIGAESQQEMQRDVQNLDADLALKKMAASFNIEQGEALQPALDRQMALDEANLRFEKDKQNKLQEQYLKLFSRV